MLFYTSEDLPFGSLLMAFVIVICVYQTKGFFLQNGGCKSPMRLVSIGVELIVSLSGTVRLNSGTCSCIAVKVHCLEGSKIYGYKFTNKLLGSIFKIIKWP